MPVTIDLPARTGGCKTRKIIELMKAPGEPVDKGDVLLTFDDDGKPGNVLSPQAGTFDEYYAQEGEEVEFNVPVCSIFTSEDEEGGERDSEDDDEADDESDDDSEPASGEESGDKDKDEEKPEESAVEYADPVQKIRNQLELMTHRNMIVQVSEHILKLCDDDFEFYEQVHNPKKSLENCIKYINNQAKKVCEEMAKLSANGPGGTQSIAIEGDQVFKWAKEYFGKENLAEDGYRPPTKKKETKAKGKTAGKGASKSGAKAAAASDSSQQSLF